MTAGCPDDPVPGLIAGQLTALAQRVQRANSPGSLDGLFAFHVLRNTPVPQLTGEVNPVTEPWLEQNAGRLENAPQLAALGYGLTHFGHSAASDEAMTRLVAGLEQLMRRAPYPSDGVTFLHDPRQLLGIGLAAETVRGKLPAFGEWLRRTTDDPRFRSADARLDLIRQHVRGILGGATPPPARLTGSEDAAHLALLHWMAAAGTARLPDTADLKALHRGVLHGTLHIRAEDLTIPDAALILAAAEDIVTASIDNATLNPGHVGVILRRFTPAMKRWRYDDPTKVKRPVQWPVASEREVQDIIWMLLRSAFDDVVDEEPLRKVGHSSYRSDFGLPRLGLLVEIKYVRSATEFKKVEKEIYEDSVAYLKEKATYKKIVVFIYDASSSAQEHATTIDALLGVEGIVDVVIASRPSQLPPPGH
jgi:hypothetical protein